MRTVSWAMSALLVCASLVGCEKSAEKQRNEAEKAAAEVEKKPGPVGTEARDKADRERDELHATVVREKVEYRAKLHEALDRIDKDLTDQKVDVKQVKRGDRSKDATLLGSRPAKEQGVIQAQLLRRDRLMDLTDGIDKTIDHDWPEFKERVDRELKEGDKGAKPGRI
jgi:hypothetical protein